MLTKNDKSDIKRAHLVRITINYGDNEGTALIKANSKDPISGEYLRSSIKRAMNQAAKENNYTIDRILAILAKTCDIRVDRVEPEFTVSDND